jgi:hypothetical protein
VNHQITAGVTDRYDHGDLQRRYRLRKRELLAWWELRLLAIVGEPMAEGNVVQLVPSPNTIIGKKTERNVLSAV